MIRTEKDAVEADETIIDLDPFIDPVTGDEVWKERGIEHMDHQTSNGSNGYVGGRVIGQAARGRMAGERSDPWANVDAWFTKQERGATPSQDLVMQPGGHMVLFDKGAEPDRGQVIGQVARGRMASQAPAWDAEWTRDEFEEVRKIDPDRREGWQPKRFGSVIGLQFEIGNPAGFANPSYFKFLLIKEPGTGWWIAPLHPNVDALQGHRHHMISRRVHGHEIPILCGPEGKPASSIAVARQFAGKWAFYIGSLLNSRSTSYST